MLNILSTLHTADSYRLTLLLGVFITITYRNMYGIIPGGLIVPGSLVVLLILSPVWFVTVLGLSFIVYGIYQYGFRSTDYKRRTPMYILACLSLSLSSIVAFYYSRWGLMPFSLDSQVGSILPGVIAFNLSKQKVGRSTYALVVCTGLTFICVLGIVGFLHYLGIQQPFAAATSPQIVLQLNYPLIHFFLALGVGYLIYRQQDIRSGGYMVAPVVALALLNPFTALYFLLGCGMVYTLAQLYCEWTLTVGLRRYVVVLSLSTLYLWGTDLALQSIDPTLPVLQGGSYILNIAMLSYVNDAIVYRDRPVLKYMILLTGISMVGIVVVDIVSYLLV